MSVRIRFAISKREYMWQKIQARENITNNGVKTRFKQGYVAGDHDYDSCNVLEFTIPKNWDLNVSS